MHMKSIQRYHFSSMQLAKIQKLHTLLRKLSGNRHLIPAGGGRHRKRYNLYEAEFDIV